MTTQLYVSRGIDRLEEAITIRDRSGSYVNGIWTPGANSDNVTTGVVQPLTAEAIAQLDLGRRVEKGIEVFTKSEVTATDRTTGTPTDTIVWGSEEYEVVKVEDWPVAGYYRAEAVRFES